MYMQFFSKRAGGAVVLLGLLVCFSACDKKTPVSSQQTPPAVVQPTLTSIQNNVFALKCAVAGCHVTGGIAPMVVDRSCQHLVGHWARSSAGFARMKLWWHSRRPRLPKSGVSLFNLRILSLFKTEDTVWFNNS